MSEISGLPYKANCFIISPYYQKIFPPALSAASLADFLHQKNNFGYFLDICFIFMKSVDRYFKSPLNGHYNCKKANILFIPAPKYKEHTYKFICF